MKRLALTALLLVACVGTTGGEVVDFPVAAAGPEGATNPLAIDTDRGWHVTLTKATLHVGAVYLSQAVPVSGAQNSACILPAAYVAQATVGLDVDLLSSAPQRFPVMGHGTTLEARAGQVWLAGGDITDVDDATPILVLEGTATKASDTRPFSATVTIGSNRQAATDLAGADPICKQRIVTPIATDVHIGNDGTLLVRVDPRYLFVNVDFASLTATNGVYAFSDAPSSTGYDQASVNLYENLHAAGRLYSFAWVTSP